MRSRARPRQRRYVGVVDEDSGEAQEEAIPKWNSVVAFKWSIQFDEDMADYEYRERADEVRKRGGIPTPKVLRDILLLKSMQKLADKQISPCRYLGVSLNTNGAESEGPFEPDPAKWVAEVGGRRAQTERRVWFEWIGVQTGSAENRKPFRVSMVMATVIGRTLA